MSVRARIAEMRAIEARLVELLADGTANAGSTIAPCAKLSPMRAG
jgi:hypothetical protein